MKKNIRNIVVAVLLVVLGLATGLGYGHLKLRKERAVFAGKVEKMESRDELLKRKYMEQKALAGQLTSSKSMIEGEKRVFEEELEKLRHEKDSALREGRSVEEKLKKEIILLEQKKGVLAEEQSKIKSEMQKNEEKYRQESRAANLTIKEKEAETGKITSEKKNLQLELKKTGQELERCRKNNAKLCAITGELMEKYRNKGVTKSILQAEPFTQLQNIEIEKLIQEYGERIEKEKISSGQKHGK